MNRTLHKCVKNAFLLFEATGLVVSWLVMATSSVPPPRPVIAAFWLVSSVVLALALGVNLVRRRHEDGILGRLGQRIWELL